MPDNRGGHPTQCTRDEKAYIRLLHNIRILKEKLGVLERKKLDMERLLLQRVEREATY